MRILLAEDDRDLADYLRRVLEEERNRVVVEFDGASAFRVTQVQAFDVMILDVMLPKMDGFEVTRRLRSSKIATPILLLTARDAPQDIVRGLDAGADDYLTKPFSFDVLLARLRARTRGPQPDSQQFELADLTMNLDTRVVTRARRALQRCSPSLFNNGSNSL